MKINEDNIVDLLIKFELVNKEVISLSRRLSEMKAECSALKRAGRRD